MRVLAITAFAIFFLLPATSLAAGVTSIADISAVSATPTPTATPVATPTPTPEATPTASATPAATSPTPTPPTELADTAVPSLLVPIFFASILAFAASSVQILKRR